MRKNDFMYTLENSLSSFPKEEREDIMYDYEEHFRIGKANGKTEEALILELGDPNTIANQYKSIEPEEIYNTEFPSNEIPSKNIFSSITIAIMLIFFNLIFILGPFLGLVGVIIGLFASAAGVIVTGLGLALAPILQPLLPHYISISDNIPLISLLFIGVGTIALGIIFFIGFCYASKFFFKLVYRYAKWNIKLITK
jgi:Predicted membrane protein